MINAARQLPRQPGSRPAIHHYRPAVPLTRFAFMPHPQPRPIRTTLHQFALLCSDFALPAPAPHSPVGYLLSAIGYPAISYRLSAISYLLFATSYRLSALAYSEGPRTNHPGNLIPSRLPTPGCRPLPTLAQAQDIAAIGGQVLF